MFKATLGSSLTCSTSVRVPFLESPAQKRNLPPVQHKGIGRAEGARRQDPHPGPRQYGVITSMEQDYPAQRGAMSAAEAKVAGTCGPRLGPCQELLRDTIIVYPTLELKNYPTLELKDG